MNRVPVALLAAVIAVLGAVLFGVVVGRALPRTTGEPPSTLVLIGSYDDAYGHIEALCDTRSHQVIYESDHGMIAGPFNGPAC